MTASVTHISERDGAPSDRRLKIFVESMLSRLPTPDSFSLYHEEKPEQALHTCKVESTKKKTSQPIDPESIVKDVLAVAEAHFLSFGGLVGQRYRLCAEAKGEILQTNFFGMGPPAAKPVADDLKGCPITKSVVDKEVMSHLKDCHGMIEKLVGNVIEPLQTLVEQNARLSAEVTKLSERRFADYELREDMLNMQAERDALRMKNERAEKRKDDALNGFLTKFMPAVANHALRKLGSLNAPAVASEEPVKKQVDAKVKEAQELLREVFKCVGREGISTALPADKRYLIDDIVGTGNDPEDMTDLANKLKILWAEIPEEVNDALQAKLLKERPDLLERLSAYAQGDGGTK